MDHLGSNIDTYAHSTWFHNFFFIPQKQQKKKGKNQDKIGEKRNAPRFNLIDLSNYLETESLCFFFLFPFPPNKIFFTSAMHARIIGIEKNKELEEDIFVIKFYFLEGNVQSCDYAFCSALFYKRLNTNTHKHITDKYELSMGMSFSFK